MAIRSREFVGIAEGIKSHELSTQSKIESLKGTVSDLSSRRFGLNREISSLEAELAAAYEDTDEDGDPNYGLISAIESQIDSAESQLSGVESELDSTNNELNKSEAELEAVWEEKEQTLFEIQERARKTSQNIATVGGMYGAYMGVGNTLQNSMQTSLASLSQAASILDGSVDGSSSGGAGGGQGRTASGGGSSAPSDLSTSALSAFLGGGSDSSFPSGSSPSNFSTNHNSGATPASTHNFGGSQSINPQKPLNFNSGQSSGSSVSMAFSEEYSDDITEHPAKFNTSEASPNASSAFNKIVASPTTKTISESANHDTPIRNSEVYQDNNGTYTVDSKGNIVFEGTLELRKGNHKNMPSKTEAYLPGDERGHINASSTGGGNRNHNVVAQHRDVNHGGYYSMEKGERTALHDGCLIQSTKIAFVDSQPSDRPKAFMVSDTVTYADGHKESIHHSFTNESYAVQTEWNDKSATFLEESIHPNPGDSLRNSMSAEQYASLMQQTDAELLDLDAEYTPTTKSQNVENDNFLGIGKRYIDPNREWNVARKNNINRNVLPNADVEMKKFIKDKGLNKYISNDKLQAKITDNTIALTPEEMQKVCKKGWNPSIMGVNNGKKSYVDSSFGPEQAKETAIHENFHQMSANDIKPFLGKTIYRRGVSVDGKGRGINEALTQMYTLNTIRSTDPNYSNPSCAYDEATTRIDDLYSFSNNKDMFDQAYFQNNPEALKKHFDEYCGEGFYEKMSSAFDVATDNRRPISMMKSALESLDEYIIEYKMSRFKRGDF